MRSPFLEGLALALRPASRPRPAELVPGPHSGKSIKVSSGVLLAKLLGICPGRRHAWFETADGRRIRKPVALCHG